MNLSAQDKRGLRLIGGVAAVVIGLFVLNVMIGGRAKPGPDGCFANTSRNTVVLLDYSDSISTQTRDEIESRAMEWVMDSVREGERVSVFTVSEQSNDSLQPIFARCRPPQDGSLAYEDARRIRREFERAFRAPLKEILGAPAGSSKKSPLAQAIVDLSLSRYMRTDTTALIVFSDMLEHNPPRFSLYGCSAPELAVEQFRDSRSGMQERPKFRNLRVMLNIVPRSNLSDVTLKCRDTLWTWFFGDNGGSAAWLEPRYLPGGAQY